MEAVAHLGGTRMHRDLPRLFEGDGAVLRDLQLLRLDRLPGLQSQQLVRRLRGLQSADRRLAAVLRSLKVCSSEVKFCTDCDCTSAAVRSASSEFCQRWLASSAIWFAGVEAV
jgi:hypothetical protein